MISDQMDGEGKVEIRTFVSKEHYIKLIDVQNLQIMKIQRIMIKKELKKQLQEANMMPTNEIEMHISPFPINVALNSYNNNTSSCLAYGIYGEVRGAHCMNNKHCKNCDNRFVCLTRYDIKDMILV